MAQVTAYLEEFDVQDRYDADGDGVFTEPDGFIDHFQIVHAGGDEASGDPVYGEDAIWSHRWYASLQAGGPNGYPGFNAGSGGASGGLTLPDNPTGVWVGDYTIQPENGGLGVFAHEYGHDLGLPDLYDTSGNTGGAENSTAFWTLMSSGSNIGDGSQDGIGDAPTDMGTYEKLQLGWLDYDLAFAGKASEHRLSPSTVTTKEAQALITVLPPKAVPLELGAPCTGCGERFFYSGSGDALNNTMTRADHGLRCAHRQGPLRDRGRLRLRLPRGLRRRHDLHAARHEPVAPAAEADQSGFNGSGAGIDGTTEGAWVDLTTTVPAGTTALRVRYQTDSAFDAERPPARRDRRGRPVDRHRGDRRGLDLRRLPHHDRQRDPGLRALLHRGEPAVPRLRRLAQDGVQLRVPEQQARLRRDPPVRGRPADQLLGHVAERQQRR